MIFPFEGNTVRLTSGYGWRTVSGVQDNHKGYDLVGVGSDEVVAAVGGTVAVSQRVTDKNNRTWQWGNYVCIKTDDGQYHYYCHLASRAVKKGDKVKAGDLIGIMGATGYTFGAHLHFECRKGNVAFNPQEVLGIPNEVGTYTNKSMLERDLEILTNAGVINSPEYWLKNADACEYQRNLYHNMAEYIINEER